MVVKDPLVALLAAEPFLGADAAGPDASAVAE